MRSQPKAKLWRLSAHNSHGDNAAKGCFARYRWLLQVREYYNFLYETFHSLDTTPDSFIFTLPAHLQKKIRWHFHRDMIRRVELLDGCSETFLVQVNPMAALFPQTYGALSPQTTPEPKAPLHVCNSH